MWYHAQINTSDYGYFDDIEREVNANDEITFNESSTWSPVYYITKIEIIVDKDFLSDTSVWLNGIEVNGEIQTTDNMDFNIFIDTKYYNDKVTFKIKEVLPMTPRLNVQRTYHDIDFTPTIREYSTRVSASVSGTVIKEINGTMYRYEDV